MPTWSMRSIVMRSTVAEQPPQLLVSSVPIGWWERAAICAVGPICLGRGTSPARRADALGLGSDSTDRGQERLQDATSPQLRLRLPDDRGSLSGITLQLLEQDRLKPVAALWCRWWWRPL
jgi:hypothetical protein